MKKSRQGELKKKKNKEFRNDTIRAATDMEKNTKGKDILVQALGAPGG